MHTGRLLSHCRRSGRIPEVGFSAKSAVSVWPPAARMVTADDQQHRPPTTTSRHLVQAQCTLGPLTAAFARRSFPGDFAFERVVAPDAALYESPYARFPRRPSSTARCSFLACSAWPGHSTGLVIKSGFPPLPRYNPELTPPPT
ncbi:hypothetical protein MRX96_056191 [Rhipicephalus microplus]